MRFCFAALSLFCLIPVTQCVAQALPADAAILCNEGDGSFQAEFPTGVSLHVGATRRGQLAARTCDAALHWSKGSVDVASEALQLDLDAFGIDLGLGPPVATFQIKKSGNSCCMELSIYSLDMPPHHLRTITGSDSFTTADTDLDGRLEIWAHDAEAVQTFERLGPGELEQLPTIVLRFTQGELYDVSSEFQPYFDRQIAELRERLDAQGVLDFKKSDGKLASTPSQSAEQIHALRAVKGKVLGILWAYLYSGREGQAWNALNEMWPSSDVARIRAAIIDARSRGIRAQVNGSSNTRTGVSRKHTQVFDVSSQGPGNRDLKPPIPILLRQPSLAENSGNGKEQPDSLLDLVIDAAGKVRSARAAGKTQAADAFLLSAVSSWKFIPAFKNGKAVACSFRIDISPKE